MNKRTCSGKGLAEMFVNGDYSQLCSYAENKYIDILLQEDGKNLSELIHCESEEIGYFEDIIISDNEMYRALFQIGILMGTLKTNSQKLYREVQLAGAKLFKARENEQ